MLLYRVLAIAVLILSSRPAAAITTFGPARPLSPNAFSNNCPYAFNECYETNPHVAADGSGVVIVAWDSVFDESGNFNGARRILFSRSTDDGAHWSSPAYLDSRGASSYGGRPQLVYDGKGHWLAVWVGPGDGYYVASRSVDGGVSWVESAPPVAGSALAANPATGTIVAAGSGRIQRSIDGGLTWIDQHDDVDPGYGDSSSGIYALANDGAGTWLLFSGGWGTTTTLFRSVDDGASWSAAIVTTLRGSLPAAANDGAGGWYLATGKDIEDPESLLSVARSTDVGQTWSTPVQFPASMEFDAGLTLLVHEEGRLELLVAAREAIEGAAGNDVDIVAFRSDDYGASWSAARALTGAARGATADAVGQGYDSDLSVVRSGSSTIAVWSSNESLRFDFGYGTDLGPDADILFAIGTERCSPLPREGCRNSVVPGASTLKLKSATNGRDSLKWQWKKGEQTLVGDFADPTVDTRYSLCLYASEPGSTRLLVEQHMDPDNLCRYVACWQATEGRFRYGDSSQVSGGVAAALLSSGADGAAAIAVQASGNSLGAPVLPLPLASEILVQLVNEQGGACWENGFSEFKANSDKLFSARSD